MTDHLAALFFSPVTTVGQGIYRPGRFDLRMTGAEWSRALPTIRLVLLDLLRTESFVDLRGHVGEARS